MNEHNEHFLAWKGAMMSWFKRQPKVNVDIVGRWTVDLSDTAALEALGHVTLEFDEIGNLKYMIKVADKIQIILMTYSVTGNVIFTDQPTHPNPQQTKFSVAGALLTLFYDGQPSRFTRVS